MFGPASKRQAEMLNSNADLTIIGGSMGSGKGSPLRTPVITPWGEKKIGDLEIGTIISGPDGSPQKVIGIQDKEIQDVFTVTMDDGSSLETDADHLWLIHKTRSQKSKTTGNFHSRSFENSCLMNTLELKSFLDKKQDANDSAFIKDQNLIIPLCDPIGFNTNYKHKIPHYVLGALLGDGCMSQSGYNITLTTADNEILQKFNSYNYPLYKINSSKYGYLLKNNTGIKDDLDDLGLLCKKSGTKFIPESYKYSSIEKRFELVRGLMDTDGYVNIKGHLSYTSVSKRLAEDFQWVVRSLGCKANIRSKKSGYKDTNDNYIQCQDSYTVAFKPAYAPQRFVNLTRKKVRCREFNGGLSVVGRRIVSVEKTGFERTRCISVSHPSRLYVTNDFIVTHNSYILNLIPLRYIHDPEFNGVCFRRNTKQIRGQGGMWQTAKSIYNQLPKEYKPTFRESDLTVTWPNGASMVYCHLEYEKTADEHQGLQYSLELFDELTSFTWYQFEYLQQRLRSGADMESRVVASCNPDRNHFTYDLVKWWLNEEGYPDDKKRGKLRYYVRRNDDFIWASNPKDLDKYLEEEGERPISVEFIGATIYDNPPMIKKNPGYLSMLKGQSEINKARNLYGCWEAVPEASGHFKRQWLNKYDKLPSDGVKVRAWDKAQTKPSEVNRYPDFTACCGMMKTSDGEYIIFGDHHPDNKDEDLGYYGKFRERSGKREQIILKQAQYDSKDCKIVLPQDPNGQAEFLQSASKLTSEGFIVKKDPAKSTAGKLIRYEPFSSACENGLVGIVESTFDSKTLEMFYKEQEDFTGERSTRSYKDDWPDSTSSAFNYLSQEQSIPIVRRNQKSNTTKTAVVLAVR
jgi:phage terminase large subunit-like protein